jgi:ATP-dependent Lon protease
MIRVPDGTLRILVQGVADRARARVRTSRTSSASSRRSRTSSRRRRARGAHAQRPERVRPPDLAASRTCPAELQLAAANVDDPSALSHLVASTLRLKTEEKQAPARDGRRRARACARSSRSSTASSRSIELGSKIQSQVQSEMEKGQREFFLASS